MVRCGLFWGRLWPGAPHRQLSLVNLEKPLQALCGGDLLAWQSCWLTPLVAHKPSVARMNLARRPSSCKSRLWRHHPHMGLFTLPGGSMHSDRVAKYPANCILSGLSILARPPHTDIVINHVVTPPRLSCNLGRLPSVATFYRCNKRHVAFWCIHFFRRVK